MLSQLQIRDTSRSIARSQLENGLIPWFMGGHIDPWNHIEATIALAIAGEVERAQKALDGLNSLQNEDGSFCHYYLSSGVKEPNRDPNVISYLALGVLALSCHIEDFDLERRFGIVAKAIDYVVSLQRFDGGFPMLVTPDGRKHPKSLLAASCSILVSLEAANFLASGLDLEMPAWKQAYLDLENFLILARSNIADKSNWAMDWYYPSFTRIKDQTRKESFGSADLLVGGSAGFVEQGLGVRCIKERSWFTAAETSEAAIAFSLSGMYDHAQKIFQTTDRFRTSDGSYLTGLTHPNGQSFPDKEMSTYSASAVLIANSVLLQRHFGSLTGHFIELFKVNRRSF